MGTERETAGARVRTVHGHARSDLTTGGHHVGERGRFLSKLGLYPIHPVFAMYFTVFLSVFLKV